MPLIFRKRENQGGAISVAPAPDINTYFRPDGTSLIFRPDGTSQYVRPA